MPCDNHVDLTLYKNKTKRWELVFEKDSAAIDITDYTIYLTVKTKKSDADASAVLSKTITTHTAPTSGKSEIALTKAETNTLDIGNYWYSIDYNNGESGTDLDEGVLMEGKLTVERPTRIG